MFKMMSQVGYLWIMRKLLSSSLDGNIAVSAAIFYKLEQWDQIYHQPVSIFTKPEKWTINCKYVYFVVFYRKIASIIESLNFERLEWLEVSWKKTCFFALHLFILASLAYSLMAQSCVVMNSQNRPKPNIFGIYICIYSNTNYIQFWKYRILNTRKYYSDVTILIVWIVLYS